MKRRDFMKSTLGGALGAAFTAVPFANLAAAIPTRIESKDINALNQDELRVQC